MKSTHVLFFVDRLLHGGIQSFLLSYARRIDPNKVRIEILTLDDGNKYSMEQEFCELGIPIYKLSGVWLRKPLDFLHQRRALAEFFSKHSHYDIVHFHSSSKNVQVLSMAKKYGIPIRIAHSHSTGFQTTKKMEILLGDLLKILLKRVSTHFFACSLLAGRWLFGDRYVKQGKVRVISNAIDAAQYRYDPTKREMMRTTLGLSTTAFVLGHVGRFTKEKNHSFLIDIFAEVYSKNPAARLLLVGQGPLQDECEKQVHRLGLQKVVSFLGYRTDVADLMQAMDVFLFPSLYEGLPVVTVECQASGLYVFASDSVTTKAQIIPEFEYIPLTDSTATWVDRILSPLPPRRDTYDDIQRAGYEIGSVTENLQSLYLALCQQVKPVN